MDFQHLKALMERTVMLADSERRKGSEGNFAALLHRLREIIATQREAVHVEPTGLPVAATSETRTIREKGYRGPGRLIGR